MGVSNIAGKVPPCIEYFQPYILSQPYSVWHQAGYQNTKNAQELTFKTATYFDTQPCIQFSVETI